MFKRSRRVEQGLTRTRRSFFGRIAGLFGHNEVTEELWRELEELLIQADVGVATTIDLVGNLRESAAQEHIREAAAVNALLREELVEILKQDAGNEVPDAKPLLVILVVGANGTGKTTSIAKLAHYYQGLGKKVILAAADTFRAAAIDQLKVWGERLGADVIAHQPGADPSAVVYDAIQAGLARKAGAVIIDTAGRLHTKYNLMQELKKMHRVASKRLPGAPHETLLVLDATTGQNALAQARHFDQAVDVTGIFLAKLDGTAKGGIVFAIAKELGIPIRFLGTGQELDDLAEFDAEEFVAGLLG